MRKLAQLNALSGFAFARPGTTTSHACGAAGRHRVDLVDVNHANACKTFERVGVEAEIHAGWCNYYDFDLVADRLFTQAADEATDRAVVIGHHYHRQARYGQRRSSAA